MLYITRNTNIQIVTNVQELATSNNYLLVIEGVQYPANTVSLYPTIETENNRFVSFIVNIDLPEGEYIYNIYDGDGVALSGDFDILEKGLLKIEE